MKKAQRKLSSPKIGSSAPITPIGSGGRFWLWIVLLIGVIALSLIAGEHGASSQPSSLPQSTEFSSNQLVQKNSMSSIYFLTNKSKNFYEQTLQDAQDLHAIKPEHEVWGVVVPHHLLAADVIATTLKQLEHQEVNRIFLLSPDHYNHGKTKITTADIPLQTPVAESPIDPIAVKDLALLSQVKIDDEIFPIEHGVGSVLPFAQVLWPQAKVVPILVRGDANAQDLRQLLAYLQKESATPGTLLIESSDFSHYLTAAEANAKDQQTINTLLSADPEKIFQLAQPANCDSLNILYLTKSIQQATASHLEIFINKNSQDYTSERVAQTTSYLTLFLSRKPLQIIDPQREILIAGDFFTGRNNLKKMREENFREEQAVQIRKITHGRPIIANFEGYLTPHCDPHEQLKLCMEAASTLDFMKKLHIVGVSLANNHALDGGAAAYAFTKKMLRQNHIQMLEDQKVTTLTSNALSLALLAVTDIDPLSKTQGHIYIDAFKKQLTELMHTFSSRTPSLSPASTSHNRTFSLTPLRIVFIHWGTEYAAAPQPRENALKQLMENFPIPVIVGAHTHVGSPLVYEDDRLFQFSLGNFFFDQPQNEAKGKILRLKRAATGNVIGELLDRS